MAKCKALTGLAVKGLTRSAVSNFRLVIVHINHILLDFLVPHVINTITMRLFGEIGGATLEGAGSKH